MNTLYFPLHSRGVGGRQADSVRTRTNDLLQVVAAANQEPRHEAWNRVYTRLVVLYGIDLATFPKGRGESLLGVAERYDLIDKVYALVYAEYLYLQALNE